MALTLAGGTTNLRSVVRSLCFEGSSDTGLFSTTQLDDLLNIAHTTLWGEIADTSPSWFTTQSSDLSITSTGYALTGLDSTNGVHSVARLELKTDTTNYVPLGYLDFQETTQTTGTAAQSSGPNIFYGWYAIGGKVYLTPTPTSTQTIRITYLPAAYALTTGSGSVSTDYPFSKALPGYDDVVAYLAAVMALEKDEASKVLTRRYEARHKALIDHVRRRQTSRPRMVIQSEWD